jgi:8-oxo-dGTP pyrophosphatase MutT (NUDIX family)
MWFEQVRNLLGASAVRRLALRSGESAAGILVPMYVADGELMLLFTRRSESLPHHAGQYSFPGGVREEGDEDVVATALRETHEELGIEPGVVMVLGPLDDVRTPTGFLISPVVGALPYPFAITRADREVDTVVHVPFLALARPETAERQEFLFEGARVSVPVYHYDGHRIWGATARVVEDLVQRLTGSGKGRTT